MKSQDCGESVYAYLDGTNSVGEAGEKYLHIADKTGEENQQWKVCPHKDGKSISLLSVSKG